MLKMHFNLATLNLKIIKRANMAVHLTLQAHNKLALIYKNVSGTI